MTTKVNNAIPVGLGSIRPSEYVLKNRFKGFPHPYSLTFPENARKMISQWCWTSAMSPSSDQAFTSQENMHKAILYWYLIYNHNQGRSWTHFSGGAEHSVPMKLFCFRRLEFYNIDVNVHQYSQYTETASTSVISWLKCLKLGCLSKKSWSCLSMTSMKALVGALNKDEALIGTFPNYF